MAKMQTSFLKERPQQLATVYLTRRDDVQVTMNPSPMGPSLLASLLHHGRDVGWHLGVEAGGTVSERGLRRMVHATESGPAFLDATASRESLFPVCLFFFTMQDDCGY